MSIADRISTRLENLTPGKFCVLVIATAALSALLRWNPTFQPADFLWAEDAVIFLAQAIEFGTASLWLPYNGYLHSIPRVAALTAASVDYVWAPTIFFAFWVAAYLLLIISTKLFLTNLRLPRIWVLATCPLLILQPHSGEVFFNLTNMQWLLGLSLTLLSLVSAGLKPKWVILPLMALLSLTGPFSILLAPILAVRCYAIRKIRAIDITVGICAIVQMVILVKSGRGANTTIDPTFTHWLSAFFTFLTFGSQYLIVQFAGVSFWAFILRRTWWLWSNRLTNLEYENKCLPVAQLLIFGALAFAAGLWAVKEKPDVITPLKDGGRYFFVPYSAAIIGFIVLLNETPKHRFFIALSILIPVVVHTKQVNFDNLQFRAFQAFAAVKPQVQIPVLPTGWRMQLQRHAFSKNYEAWRHDLSLRATIEVEGRNSQHTARFHIPMNKKCASADYIGIEVNFQPQIISSAELTTPDIPGFKSIGTYDERQKNVDTLQFALNNQQKVSSLHLALTGQNFHQPIRIAVFCIRRNTN